MKEGDRTDWKLTAIPLMYLVVLLVLSSVDRPFIWGANHLRYHSIWVWIVCSTLLVSVSIPAVRSALLGLKISSFVKVPSPVKVLSSFTRYPYAALIGIAALSFVVLRDATHLLGDGYLLVRELDHGFRKIANEPLSLWILHRSLAVAGEWGVTANTLFFAWSFIPGIAYVALVPHVATQISSSDRSRVVLSLFLLLPGFVQLFFGYHETYPVLYPLLLIYVSLGLRAQERHLPAWIPCTLLGLMISLHFTMVTLVPSVFVILGAEGDLGRRVRNAIRGLGAVVPGVLIVSVMLWLADFDLATYLNRATGETLLPLFTEGDHSIPYGAISVAHLTEFVSEMLLVYLPTLIVLPFVTKTYVRSGASLFLLSAAIPAGIATFVGFTVIGAFRDWDALAFPALFTTVWAGLGLIQCCDRQRIRQVCCVVVAVAGVNTILWVTVNADPKRSTRRFEEALTYSHLSPRARAFGWETIGAYYMDTGEMGRASLSYEYAMESDPKHPRYPSLLGFILMQVGNYKGAAENFRRSITLDDTRYEAPLNLGLALVQLNDPEAAVEAIQRALELRPDFARISFALGVAYYAGKDYDQAITAYENAVRLQPRLVTAHLNLGQLYGLVGDNLKKRERFERVLALKPDHPQREEIREWLRWRSRIEDVKTED